MNAHRQRRRRLTFIAAVLSAALVLGVLGWFWSVGHVPEYAFLRRAQPVVTPSALGQEEDLSHRWRLYRMPGSWEQVVNQAEGELGKRGYRREAFPPLPFAVFSKRRVARTITVQIDQQETDGVPVVWVSVHAEVSIPSATRMHNALVGWLMDLRL